MVETLTPTSGQELPSNTDDFWKNYNKRDAERINSTPGKLNLNDGFDCSLCMNRGHIAVVDEDDYLSLRNCKCMQKRKQIQLMKKSGAYELIPRCTMNKFIAKTEWQQKIKNAVSCYIEAKSDNWLFAGGQTGAGKTHLCSAAFFSLFEKGDPGIYIMWRQEARKLLKSGFAQAEEVDRRLDELSQIPLLYIDDLFKTDTDIQARPERREIELAFEIINTRYNKDRLTIISSEFMMRELAEISQAIAGRIYEKCGKDYILDISPERGKNYRLSGLRG